MKNVNTHPCLINHNGELAHMQRAEGEETMLTFPLSKSDITHCAFAESLVSFTERIMTELLRELCRDTFTQGLNF